MKNYQIKSFHDISVDHYEEGELDHANNYTLHGSVLAENPEKAIKKFFEEHLGFDYNHGLAYIEDSDVTYDILIDAENCEVKKEDALFKLWKEGRVTLFNDRILVQVYEIKRVKLKTKMQ